MSSDGERHRRGKTKKRRCVDATENDSGEEYGGTLAKTRRNQSGNELPQDTKKFKREKNEEMSAAGSSCNANQHDKTVKERTSGQTTLNNTETELAGSQQYPRTSRTLSLPEITSNDKDVARSMESHGKIAKANRESSDHCPICLTSFRSQEVGTPNSCNHFFCLQCITEWANSTNTCPVDRQRFSAIIVRENYGGQVTNSRAIPTIRYQQYSPEAASRVSNSSSDYNDHIWAEYTSDSGMLYESEDNMASLSTDEDLVIVINETEDTEEQNDSMHENLDDAVSQYSPSLRDDQYTRQSSASSTRDAEEVLEESLSSHEMEETSCNAEIDSSITEASSPSNDDDDESDGVWRHSEAPSSPALSPSSNDSEGGYYYSGYSQSGEDSGPASIFQTLESTFHPSDSSDSSGSFGSSAVSARYSSSTDYSF